ncbi:hypothetical protein [Nocardia acidivorans]|uniref:hypothetical protein n=1 Tax=Nocardia acidivorans TaxID=404580 RepID=UPI0014718D68|nr:hypothetical protein [Nocardia acidivorans]
MLTDGQVDAFIADGYIKVEGAFPREVADAGPAGRRVFACGTGDPARARIVRRIRLGA